MVMGNTQAKFSSKRLVHVLLNLFIFIQLIGVSSIAGANECLACTQEARSATSNVVSFPQCCGDYPPEPDNPNQCGSAPATLDTDADGLLDIYESFIFDQNSNGIVDALDATTNMLLENVPLPAWAMVVFSFILFFIVYSFIRHSESHKRAIQNCFVFFIIIFFAETSNVDAEQPALDNSINIVSVEQGNGGNVYSGTVNTGLNPQNYNTWLEVENNGVYEMVEGSLNASHFSFNTSEAQPNMRLQRCLTALDNTSSTVLSQAQADNSNAIEHNSAAGILQGAFEVSNYGAANYDLPIELPPGTAGIVPRVGFKYNSQSHEGLLGLNWTLSGLSSIYRCSSTLDQDGFIDGVDFDSNDKFCLDGNRLIAVSGSYGADGTEYRLENDNFSRIISYGSSGNSPAHFKVWTKAGEIIEYGNHTNAYLELQNTQDIIVWAMNKVSDTVDNYYTVTYAKDIVRGEQYPVRIDYTANDTQGLAAYNSVVFSYETRPDVMVTFLSGNRMEKTQRLKNVTVNHQNKVVRRYVMNYKPVSFFETDIKTSPYRTLLDSVELIGADGNKMLPLTLTWSGIRDAILGSSGVQKYQESWGQEVRTSVVNSGYLGTDAWLHSLADINGDGQSDVIWRFGSTSTNEGIRLHTSLSNGDGGYTPLINNIPIATGNYPESTWQPEMADVNGDGLADAVWIYGSTVNTGVRVNVSLSNGDGTFQAMQQSTPKITGAFGAGWSKMMADVNGDGLPDAVWRYGYSANDNGVRVYVSLSNGDGTFGTLIESSPATSGNYTSTLWQPLMADVNGDALADAVWVYASTNTDGVRVAVSLSNGDGTFEPMQISDLPDSHGFSFAENEGWSRTMVDVNGDGLADAVWMRSATLQEAAIPVDFGILIFVSLSNGDGTFSEFIDTLLSNGVQDFNVPNFTRHFADMNADGLVDLVILYGSIFNYGYNGVIVLHSKGDGTFDIPLFSEQTHLISAWEQGWTRHFGDANGDGLPEPIFVMGSLVEVDGGGNVQPSKGAAVATTLSEFTRIELSSIHDGIKEVARWEIEPLSSSSSYIPGVSSIYPLKDLNVPLTVVTRAEKPDGVGGTQALSYAYEGLKSQVFGRGLLGFESITVTDEQTGIQTITRFLQDFPYINQIESIESRLSSGQLISSMTNTLASLQTTAQPTYFAYASDTVMTDYLLDDNFNQLGTVISTTQRFFDSFGNLTNQILTKTHNGQTFSQQTTNLYTNDAVNWLIGQLDRTETTHLAHNQPSITKTASFSYEPVTGLRTKEVIEPDNTDDNIRLTLAYSHDAFGNVETTVQCPGAPGNCTAQTSNARTTTVNYDNRGQFPEVITNALGQQAFLGYDARFGLLAEETTINNQTTLWQYDAWGNQRQLLYPDNTERILGRVFCGTQASGQIISCPTVSGQVAHFRERFTESDGQQITRYYDERYREIRTETLGFDGTIIIVDTEYDNRARIARVSEPYFTGGTVYWRTNHYDVLDRITRFDYPNEDGSILTDTVSHLELSTQVTNAANQTRTEVRNVAGYVVNVEDALNYNISYQYDSLGNLINTTDELGNSIIQAYDIRSRKISMNDPDLGISTYSYNTFDDLTEKNDANSQVIRFEYDKLGRPTKREDIAANNSTTEQRWNYDYAQGAGIGQLNWIANITSGDITQYTYDSLGRVTQTQQTIQGKNFTIQQTYDANSRLQELIYPSSLSNPNGFKVEYIYNAYGYLQQVQSEGSNPTVYWQALTHNARNQLTQSQLGNATLVTKTVSDANGYIKGIRTQDALNQTLQYSRYLYDDAGNITQRWNDIPNGITETLTYDGLNRVKTATVSGGMGVTYLPETYNYDAIGNFTSKTGVGSYTYGTCSAGPHAVCSAGVNSYTYDANGNRITGGGEQISYSVTNKVETISSASQNTEFFYDSNDNRLLQRRTAGGIVTSTYYVGLGGTGGQTYQLKEEGSKKEHTYFIYGSEAQPVAAVLESNDGAVITTHTEYYHRDHLTSVELITDELGGIISRLSHDIWGQRRQLQTTDDLSSEGDWNFTGHERLMGSSLIHMNGRVFDPIVAKFTSADPYVPDSLDMQSYNRYAYVTNNPLKFIDPSGFCAATYHFYTNAAPVSVTACIPGGNRGGSTSGIFDNSGLGSQGDAARVRAEGMQMYYNFAASLTSFSWVNGFTLSTALLTGNAQVQGSLGISAQDSSVSNFAGNALENRLFQGKGMFASSAGQWYAQSGGVAQEGETWWARNVVRPWAEKTGIDQYAGTPDYYTDEEKLLIGFLGSGGGAAPGKITITSRSSALTTNVEKEVFTYAPRVRARGVQDPKSHNFPYSFDKTILRSQPIVKESGYRIYQSPGFMNDKAGLFEIGVTPNNVINHRFFRPN